MRKRQLVVCVCALALAAAAADKPSVRASGIAETGLESAAITVEAEDSVGLDSLALAWPAGDLTVTTELSGSSVNRSFRRAFQLRDLFPDATRGTGPVRITVLVRNTRGATASTVVLLRPHGSHER